MLRTGDGWLRSDGAGPPVTLQRAAGTQETTNEGLSLLCRQKPNDGDTGQGCLRARRGLRKHLKGQRASAIAQSHPITNSGACTSRMVMHGKVWGRPLNLSDSSEGGERALTETHGRPRAVDPQTVLRGQDDQGCTYTAQQGCRRRQRESPSVIWPTHGSLRPTQSGRPRPPAADPQGCCQVLLGRSQHPWEGPRRTHSFRRRPLPGGFSSPSGGSSAVELLLCR